MKLSVNEKSLSLKFEAIMDKAEDAAFDKVVAIASDAVALSPVDTGAFVESWSIVPKGSSGGRSRSANTRARRAVSGKLSAGQKQAIRTTQVGVLTSDAHKHLDAIIKGSGAVIRNRAPHQPYVKPTTEGQGPGSGRGDANSGKRLLAAVRDKHI